MIALLLLYYHLNTYTSLVVIHEPVSITLRILLLQTAMQVVMVSTVLSLVVTVLLVLTLVTQ